MISRRAATPGSSPCSDLPCFPCIVELGQTTPQPVHALFAARLGLLRYLYKKPVRITILRQEISQHMLNQVCAHCKVTFTAWTQSLTHSQVLDPVGWARPHYCLKYLSKHPHTTLHFNLYWKTVICIPCGTLQEGARLPPCVQKQGSSLVRAQRTLQDAKRTLARWLQLLGNFFASNDHIRLSHTTV